MPFVLECEPRFDYARAEHETIITELGAVFRSADLALMLESMVPMERTERGVRAAYTLHAGDSCTFLLEVCHPDQQPRHDRRAGGRRGLQPHRPLLARLAGQVDLPRALARDGAPIRPDPEAAHLPPHRRASSRLRPPACPRASAASATGTTATPGSATPPSRSTACCGSASPRRPRPSWAGCPTATARAPAAATGRCRSCTASTAAPTWRSRCSTTSRATAAPAPCGSETAPPPSCSSTPTAS